MVTHKQGIDAGDEVRATITESLVNRRKFLTASAIVVGSASLFAPIQRWREVSPDVACKWIRDNLAGIHVVTEVKSWSTYAQRRVSGFVNELHLTCTGWLYEGGKSASGIQYHGYEHSPKRRQILDLSICLQPDRVPISQRCELSSDGGELRITQLDSFTWTWTLQRCGNCA